MSVIGRLERCVWLAFLIVAAVNLFFVGRIAVARFQLTSLLSGYGSAGDSSVEPPFVAYRSDGTRIERSESAAGTAVWYASKGCAYCKQDPQWDGLAARLKERGFDIVILLPGLEHAFPDDERRPPGAQQATFVSGEWIRRYPLSTTPTLLVFERNGRLLSYKSGVLNRESAVSVMAAVDAAAAGNR